MRRIRYSVAASLDGYIAGPNGEADWITMDSDIDFSAIFKQFDTFPDMAFGERQWALERQRLVMVLRSSLHFRTTVSRRLLVPLLSTQIRSERF